MKIGSDKMKNKLETREERQPKLFHIQRWRKYISSWLMRREMIKGGEEDGVGEGKIWEQHLLGVSVQ